MNVNERLVALLAPRANRLANEQTIDRKATATVPGVPPRAQRGTADAPASPWEAARAQLCAHGVVDGSRRGDELLDALLANSHATADELRALHAHPNVTAAQRVRILKHPHMPGEVVIAYVLDVKHDTTMFAPAALDDQLAMLSHVAGVTGEMRLQGWAALLVRTASAPAVEEHTGRILMAAPDASAVLHAAVERAFTTFRRIPVPLGRHVLSHMSTPATIALLSLRSLFRLLDEAEDASIRTERLADVLCDLLCASCGSSSKRWEKLFRLAPDWDASIDALLDEVENDAGSVSGRRRDVPGYQRDPRSSLLRPIDYSVIRSPGAGAAPST